MGHATSAELEVRRALEVWARHKAGADGSLRSHTGGWTAALRETSVSRLVDGMPSTVCPACDGRRQVLAFVKARRRREFVDCEVCGGIGRLDIETRHRRMIVRCSMCERGEIDGRTCLHCRGTGQRVIDRTTVNPAFIASTRRGAGSSLYELVERAIQELPIVTALVLQIEYLPGKHRTRRDRFVELGIGKDAYASRLRDGYAAVAKALGVPWSATG